MGAKRTFKILCFLILWVLMGGMVMSGCGPGQLFGPTITSTPTLTPPNTIAPTPTLTPTITLTNTPTTTDPDQSWNTNFADLTESLDGIHEQNSLTHTSDAALSIETGNVNSGGKAIKDSGNMHVSDNLCVNFNIQQLTGRDRIDLSNKTLSIEMYMPEKEQLYPFFFITLAGAGDSWRSITVRANMRPVTGWFTYKVDLNMVLELGSWQYNDWLHSPEITSQADALALLQDVKYIQITAQNLKREGYTYFLVDKLGWEPSGPMPAYDPSVDSLRKYGDVRNLLVGAWMFFEGISDPDYMNNFFEQFAIGSDFGELVFPADEPGDGFTAFANVPKNIFLDSLSDRLGTGLIRFMIYPTKSVIPQWMIGKSYDEMTQVTKDLVRAQALSHKGKTKIWVMFNELLDYRIGGDPNFRYTDLGLKNREEPTDPNLPQIWENEYSPFSADSSDIRMLVEAFQEAHRVDPEALLFFTEFGEVKGDYKSDAVYDLAVALKAASAPIDGVGLQTHVLIGQDGRIDDQFTYDEYVRRVTENIERYQAAGLDVYFSELDVSIFVGDIDSSPAGQQKLAERRQLQADVYRALLHIALTHSNVVAYVMFAWANTYTWIGYDISQEALVGKYGDLGIYDENWEPKPAYYALLDELKGSEP